VWLLVGGDSEIGAAAHRALTAAGRSVAATTRRAEHVAGERPLLDLARPLDDWQPPAGTRSACVFAAVARLAACAGDPAGSAHINVTQTLAVIERLLARDIHVVFLSTNQVFDGKTANVQPEVPTCPVSEYGRQKARTEAALGEHMARGAPVAILRLAKVASPGMALIKGWVDALTSGKPIRAFHDMTMAPTPTGLVMTAIEALMSDRAQGIYQLTGPRDVAYSEVGRFLARRLAADAGLVCENSALEAGLPEGANPPHTTLDPSRLRERYGFEVPDAWDVIEALDDRLGPSVRWSNP
jgi:dTDP-4-dehydrorhamnose reductase